MELIIIIPTRKEGYYVCVVCLFPAVRLQNGSNASHPVVPRVSFANPVGYAHFLFYTSVLRGLSLCLCRFHGLPTSL